MNDCIKEEISDLILIAPSASDNAVEAKLKFPADFTGFQGHFDHGPILPGVAIIDAVLAAGEKVTGSSLKLSEIKTAKFFAPVFPEMTVKMEVVIEQVDAGYSIKAKVFSDDRNISRIRVVAGRSGRGE